MDDKIEMYDSGTTNLNFEPKGIGQSIEEKFSEDKMSFKRFFTLEGKSPFQFDIYGNPINWVREEVNITDDRGKTVFTQQNVKRPDFWSSLALKVVASKYFWGDQEKNEREDSVEKLIGRVSRYVQRQSLKQKYFDEQESRILKEEIDSICINQLAAFNSPVWFNTGIQEYDQNAGGVADFIWDSEKKEVIKSKKTMDRPQCSACFIKSVEDDMDSILALQVSEARLFKAGSGTGTNRSTLRSSKEKLTGGGQASGPLSFMKGYDAYAGIIKSGGKTRRAAKMEILNVDHPDIIEFIESKQKEEKKAWALIEQGYNGGMNGEAYGSVAFQNCNMSVRISDKFMEAVKNDTTFDLINPKDKTVWETVQAKEIFDLIVDFAWKNGEPGVLFIDEANRHNPVPQQYELEATNPCSEQWLGPYENCCLGHININSHVKEGKVD